MAPSLRTRAVRRLNLPAGNALDSPAARAAGKTAARVACRFGAVYSGIYCLTTPQIYLALRGGGLGHLQAAADSWAKLWAIRPVRSWVASHVFGTTVDERFDGGDDRYAWVGQFCWLAAAAAVTPVWSVLDRRPTQYATAHPWFRLAVRLCLAGQMFHYGAAKAVPLQFQLPLSKLVEPFGNFSPMSALWAQTASSEAYQILLGCAEIAGGLLLVHPRTTTLGALLCAVELAQVFLLNMTFDVPVKIHSFHLLLLSLVLLAPESARLAAVFLSDGAVRPSPLPALFRSPAANRAASADGRRQPPLVTDAERWRRVVFESADAVTERGRLAAVRPRRAPLPAVAIRPSASDQPAPLRPDLFRPQIGSPVCSDEKRSTERSYASCLTARHLALRPVRHPVRRGAGPARR